MKERGDREREGRVEIGRERRVGVGGHASLRKWAAQRDVGPSEYG